jgi:hypothetical protein
MTKLPTALKLIAGAAALCCAAGAMAQNSLVGWAIMPAATYSDGPISGQFGISNSASPANNGPFKDASGNGLQPVQGFSGVLAGAGGSYRFLVDNGFGAKANSPDSLLRMYAITPDFRTATGGTGTVSAADWNTGALRSSFDATTRITFNDANSKLGFGIVADQTYYPIYQPATNSSNPSAIAVDATIKSGRLLTGADLDHEGVVVDKNGKLWVGDEFGPFLVKADATTGTVLRSEISLPGVSAPENPYRGATPANLGSSRGFEGLAINKTGDRIYTLLEGTVIGDLAKTLRINQFSVDSESYTANSWLYLLEAEGTNIGDMTAINDHEFIVIERNGSTATSTNGIAPFKKLFKIDINLTDGAGHVKKTELVNLMNIADPNDLNGDGSTTFTFPFVTIENVIMVDDNTVMVVNDNNFPFGGGRAATSDNTEFLLISLGPVPEPGTWALMACGLLGLAAASRRRRAN